MVCEIHSNLIIINSLLIMKKTLITLLALAGVVAAADTVTIAPLTSSEGWTVGHQNTGKSTNAVLDTTAATLTLTNGDWSRGYGVYTLADAITLTNEADRLTVSFTINTTDLNSLVTGTLVGSDKAITLGHGSYNDSGNGGNGIQSGISTDTTGVFYNMQNNKTGGVFVTPDKKVNDSFIVNTPLTLTTTVEWNTTKSQFVASLSYGKTSLTSYDLGTSYTLDKLVFSLDGGVSTQTVSGVSVSANLVPEPATATLSLLALAGLAARRRRK